MKIQPLQPDDFDLRTSSVLWRNHSRIQLSSKFRRMHRTKVWFIFLVISIVGIGVFPSTGSGTELPPWLQADIVSGEVVSVRVYKDNQLAAEGAGVVINSEGYVITSAAVLDAGPRITVIANNAEELAAIVQLKEKDSGFGILKVEGLSSTGLPLSTESPASGIRIFAVPPGSEDGEVSVVVGAIGESEVRSTSAGEISILRHNAMIPALWYGSPAIDECGRMVALNIPDPQAFYLFIVPRKKDPEDAVFALSTGDIASRLMSLGINFVREEEACVTAEIRAQQRAQEAQEAQERARQAEEEIRMAGEQIQQAQSQTESAQEEARLSREAREQAQIEADQARQEALQAKERAMQAESEAERAQTQLDEAHERVEEARRSSEELRRLAIWGGAIGILLLLLLLYSWLTMIKRRKHEVSLARSKAASAQQEAEDAKLRIDEISRTAPFDCVLTGIDHSGSPLALSIRREALGDPVGVVIGRSPDGSAYIVTDASVSREHAKVSFEDGILYVEDLNSTNGSVLNGHPLMPGKRSQINTGDELKLGSVSFQIHLKE